MLWTILGLMILQVVSSDRDHLFFSLKPTAHIDDSREMVLKSRTGEQ